MNTFPMDILYFPGGHNLLPVVKITKNLPPVAQATHIKAVKSSNF